MIIGTILFLVTIIPVTYYHRRIFRWSAGPNDDPNYDAFFSLPWFQRRRTKTMTIVMKIFTNIVNPQVATCYLIVFLIISKFKKMVFKFFFFCSFVVYAMMCLKSIFHDPRPYMVNRNIKPLEKYAEYGNPSGHVLMGHIVINYIFESKFYHHPLFTTCNKGYN